MANKILITAETVTTWTGSGGDKILTLANLATGVVAMGAYLDLGPSPRPEEFQFTFKTGGFATEPIEGEAIPIHFSQSEDSLLFDGAPSTAPLASTVGTMTVSQLKNTLEVVPLIVPSTSTTASFKTTGLVRLTSRYVSPCIHNATSDSLANTATGHSLKLNAIPREIQ